MIGNNIKLVIFDLYNTLVVPGRQANSPYERLFKAAGLEMEEATKLRTVLLTQKFLFDDFVKRFLPQIPKQQVSIIKDYLEKELANTKLFPEVNEVLEKLYTKYDLCLISNASADFKRPFFRLGLDKYFDKVIFSCDVGYTKPNPEIYKMGMMGHKSDEILMIGDSIKSDYNGPKAVGFHAKVIDRKGAKDVKNKITNLAELT